MILIVGGVAGSGKTTVGALVAGNLHWEFADGDTFHSASNVEKMRQGIPLTDADRKPWLDVIAGWIDDRITHGECGVITCSGLKRSYREQLMSGRPHTRMVFLEASREELLRRLASRRHFFPEQLLDSQLAALEGPSPDEDVYVVSTAADANATADKILAWLDPPARQAECARLR